MLRLLECNRMCAKVCPLAMKEIRQTATPRKYTALSLAERTACSSGIKTENAPHHDSRWNRSCSFAHASSRERRIEPRLIQGPSAASIDRSSILSVRASNGGYRNVESIVWTNSETLCQCRNKKKLLSLHLNYFF